MSSQEKKDKGDKSKQSEKPVDKDADQEQDQKDKDDENTEEELKPEDHPLVMINEGVVTNYDSDNSSNDTDSLSNKKPKGKICPVTGRSPKCSHFHGNSVYYITMRMYSSMVTHGRINQRYKQISFKHLAS